MELRWRELPFWQLEYRRVEGEPLVRSMWVSALWGACALVLAALFGLAFKQGFAAPYLSLAALVVAHLIARGQLERRLPNPSFARDLQTGHLDQFRLLDLAPHALLLQRGLPALFYRLQSHILWLPLYGAWGAWLGNAALDSVLLWLLFAFADPLVLVLMSFYLTLSFGGIWEPLTLALLVFGYGSLQESERARFGALSGWLFALLISIPILLRLLMPLTLMYTLPDIGRFTLVWLLTEGLRWERRARWLNMPSGLWRYGWLLPAAGLMLMGFPLVWEWTPAWSDAQRLQGAAVLLFLVPNWLNRQLVTLVRGRDPVQQRWGVHLREVVLGWVLSTVVLFGWALRNVVALGGHSFWLLLLLLVLADVPFSGGYRMLLQRAYCMRIPLTRLAFLSLAPILWFLLAPDHYASLGVLNPLVALAAQTPLWGLVVRQPPPPFLLLLMMPLLWRALMLVLAWLWVHWGWRLPQGVWWQRVLTPLLLYPLYDWVQRRMTSNPVTRFFMVERRFDPAPLFAGLGWVLGLVLPTVVAVGWAILMLLPVLIALWWTGYRLASQRVQRLVETGELRQWFLTGLAPFTIYWGIVLSVWNWQARLLVALYGCGALAAWGRAFYEAFRGSSAPSAMLSAPFVVLVAGGMATLSFGAVLVLLCSQLFLAAPIAIQDTLTALSRQERPSIVRATVLSLLYSGCMVLACMFTPLLLVGLPFYSTRSERILRQLARAPDEYLRRLPAPGVSQ